MDLSIYTPSYYTRTAEDSRRSAAAVVPHVVELVHPRSVVDIGCGLGVWLAEFKRHGVSDVMGVDGAYTKDADLELSADEFIAHDLTQPFQLERKFDLAMSLEVAEHLAEEHAAGLVQSLVALAPVVLFSAAVPGQGGEHHVNEQWPEYWVEQFQRHGYLACDVLRHHFWNDERVKWWYAQNMLLFVDESELERYPALSEVRRESGYHGMSVIHPQNYLCHVWKERVLRAAISITAAIPDGETFLFADQDEFGEFPLGDRTAIPFLERDGFYGGPPVDAEQAIRELDRAVAAGIRFLVIGWPAFWWLDHYAGFRAHVDRQFRCVLQNDDVVILTRD